jgi:hypothetical protein
MAAPTVRDLGASLVRTFVTLGVGWAVAKLAQNANVIVDDQTSSGLVQSFTVAVTAVYYLVVRFLETKIPAFGWLFGLAKLPTYPSATNEVPVPASGTVPTK